MSKQSEHFIPYFFYVNFAFYAAISKLLSCWTWILPVFTNRSQLDLHYLLLSMWICIHSMGQVTRLAENYKWARHLNLFNMTRVLILSERQTMTMIKLLIWHCTVCKCHFVRNFSVQNLDIYLKYGNAGFSECHTSYVLILLIQLHQKHVAYLTCR